MAASNQDKFTHVGVPGTATTLAAPGHTVGGTGISVVSTNNWSSDTGIVFAIDQVTTSVVNGVSTQVRVAGTYTEWEGTVSSSTGIANMVLKYGTDQNYPAGSTTRVYIPVSATRENNLVDGILVDHDQQGRHKQLTDTNGNKILGLNPTASAVNYPQVTNSVTGSPVQVAPAGSDANIDYQIAGKGTGIVYADGAAPQKLAASFANFVESGCVITFTASTLNWSMTSGFVWVNGKRYTVAAATGTVTASKDTYFDVLIGATQYLSTLVNTSGNIVANNAASPTLAANSIRIGKIVSAAAITSVTQSGYDSLANYIYNQRPNVPTSKTTRAYGINGLNTAGTTYSASGTTYTVNSFSATTFTSGGGVVMFFISFNFYTNSQNADWGLQVDGAQYGIGTTPSTSSANVVTGLLPLALPAGSHTAYIICKGNGSNTWFIPPFTSPLITYIEI